MTFSHYLFDGHFDIAWVIINIGNATPVELIYFIESIEKAMGKVTKKEFLPMQDGDVLKTFAETTELEKVFNYSPSTSIDTGVLLFVDWFKKYYWHKWKKS